MPGRLAEPGWTIALRVGEPRASMAVEALAGLSLLGADVAEGGGCEV